MSEEQSRDTEQQADPAQVRRVAMPVVGELWLCRGFTFRVDDVQNGEVYFVRWNVDQERGVPMRCDIALWQSEMADATKIWPAKPRDQRARKENDEFRKDVDALLPNTYRPTRQMQDWMDINGIPKIDRVRCSLLRVAKLANDGLTLEQIKGHRLVRAKKTMAPYIDEFFAKWSSR